MTPPGATVTPRSEDEHLLTGPGGPGLPEETIAKWNRLLSEKNDELRKMSLA